MAVLPHANGKGKAEATKGKTPTLDSATSAGSPSATPSLAGSPAPPHANSIHYRHFTDPVGIVDFHTKKRDHSSLECGVLDEDGILAHTDFDIDLSRIDADNDEFFSEYVARRTKFEEQLKLFYDKTPSQ